MKNLGKIIWIIALIAIIILIGVVGYGYFKKATFKAENPTVTAAELASMLGLTSRHIQRLIKDLVENEIIRREGGRKFGKWIIL